MNKDQSIDISEESFEDLSRRLTGNPIAESEILDLLRKAIQSGKSVVLTDPNGKPSYTLQLDDQGKFNYVTVV